MASSFQGWGNTWANTWEKVTDPNAMYGSAVIRVTAIGNLTGVKATIPKAKKSSISGWQQAQEELVRQKKLRLQQDDQLVTELLVSLVTQGFFYE